MTASIPEATPVGHAVSRTRRTRVLNLRPGILVTLVAVTCAFALLAALHALSPEPVRVEVNLSASAGTRIALYVNDLTRPPLIQPLVPGGPRKYAFDGIVEDITMLRVDPTDVGGATVDLHSIVVVGASGALAQFGPRALAGWATDALAVAGFDETALHVRTTGPYSIITSGTEIPIVRKRNRWTRWMPMVNAPDTTWRLAAASLFLLLVAASVDPARRLHVPVAAAAVGLVMSIIAFDAHVPDAPASAAVAVSRATFMGVSTRPALLASIALLVGAILIGSAAGFIDRRRQGVGWTAPAFTIRAGVGGLVVLGVSTSLGLQAWASAMSTRRFVPQWDYDNLLYWAYLTHKGNLPFLNFWHPYGGFFVFDLPFPTGPGLRWLYDITLFGIFFVAFGRWKGALSASLATTALFLGQRLGLLPGMERYLLAVNVVFSYLSRGGDEKGLSGKAVFWCACALALFFEPPQLVYAGVPVGLIVAAEVRGRWGTLRRDAWLIRRLGADFGVPVLTALVLLAALALSGQLRGFLAFYGRLGDVVAYSAWPTGLPDLQMTGFPRALLVLACSAIMIAVGTYEYFAGGARRAYGEALAGIGVVTLMVLQKHFVRWMDEHLLMPAVLSVMVLGLGWSGRRRVADYVVGGVILGAFAAMLVAKPTTRAVLTAVLESPQRAVSDISVLTRHRVEFEPANTARFASDRFAAYASERQVIDRLHDGSQADVRVFALTDDPVLYILTGQPAVWMANMYDASPVYDQARVVRWLREEKPPYTVLDPDRLMWDGFQKVVRVPLVFSEVVYTYVPFEVVSRLYVFRRREPAEPPALTEWRERLGSDVDVGRLASVSSFGGDKAACPARCGDLLEVHVPLGASGRVSVPMTVSGLSFSVTFTCIPSATDYRVLLDHVWFWNVAKRDGLPHAVGWSLPAGVYAQVRSVRLKSDALY